MPPLVEHVERVWSSTWAEIGPKQVRPVAPIVGGWHRLPPSWADVADMFFCSDNRLCSEARSCELQSYSRTSRDSNHHRQSVSVKRDAIPTEPRGRLTKWGEAMLGTCWLETVNWDDVVIKNIQTNYVLWFRVLVDGLLCSKVAPPVRVPWNRWIVRFARPLNYHVPALLVR